MPANSPAFDPDTPNLAPDEFVEVSRAMASSTRLLLLDQFWTREAKRASTSATRDGARVQALTGVIEEMDQLLKDYSDLAPTVATIAKRADTNLQARYEASSPAPRSTDPKPQGEQRHSNCSATTSRQAQTATPSPTSSKPPNWYEPAPNHKHRNCVKNSQKSKKATQTATWTNKPKKPSPHSPSAQDSSLGPEAAGAVIVVAEIIDCLT